MYELKSIPQIDEAANVLVRLVADKPHFVRFDSSDHYECHICTHFLDVYYCENGVYAVRCPRCGILTLVIARNPEDALRKVGSYED